jgi:hypothetical protein
LLGLSNAISKDAETSQMCGEEKDEFMRNPSKEGDRQNLQR